MTINLDKDQPMALYVGPRDQLDAPRTAADVVHLKTMLALAPWSLLSLASAPVVVKVKDGLTTLRVSIGCEQVDEWFGFGPQYVDRFNWSSVAAVQGGSHGGVWSATVMSARFVEAELIGEENKPWRGHVVLEVNRWRRLEDVSFIAEVAA